MDMNIFELAKIGTPEEIREAVKKGADVNDQMSDGLTPLSSRQKTIMRIPGTHSSNSALILTSKTDSAKPPWITPGRMSSCSMIKLVRF